MSNLSLADTQHTDAVIYSIDENDKTIFVNDNWYEFAGRNGGRGLSFENIKNKKIWDFISCRETKHLYDVILDRVRSDDAAISVPFRCDSPDRRRHMRLEIKLNSMDHIQFTSYLL